MSKRSEEFANKAYPNYSPDGKTQVDMSAYRFACTKGYEQAERDLADAFQAEYAKELARADGIDDIVALKTAAQDLVDAVERYTRQECSRFELLNAAATLKSKLK